MIHVKVVGDEKFYRDANSTIARSGHYLMEALDDISGTIGRLARAAAPGRLGEAVGQTPVTSVGGDLYRGAVGVRRVPVHAKYVHEGTGVFGPLHRPYTIEKRQTNFPPNWGIDRTGRMNPAVGNVMRIVAGDGDVYFRKRVTVQGQKPQPFLTEAFEIAKFSEIPLRVQRLARKIARHGWPRTAQDAPKVSVLRLVPRIHDEPKEEMSIPHPSDSLWLHLDPSNGVSWAPRITRSSEQDHPFEG